MPSDNINNSFFYGTYKDVWRALVPDGLTEAEADFIQEVADLKTGEELLDIMCGYGRHVLELGRRGIAATGIDNLGDYVGEINQTATTENLSAVAFQANVLTVELDKQYDAVICMGNSFAFFNRKDAMTLLKNIAGNLKPGGVFIINSWMIAEIAMKFFVKKDWYYAGDYKCIYEYEYLFFPSRIEFEQTLISPKGSIETIEGVDYIFSIDELSVMFGEVGLRIKNLYSTPRKKKFLFGDSRIYIVAELSR